MKTQRTTAESVGVLFAAAVFLLVAAFCARFGWALAGRILGIAP
jgi:hypothetical protein